MKGKEVFFKSVKALPDFKLKIHTGTNASIEFDFSSRLKTMRFGVLRDSKLFSTAHTDGDFILFGESSPKVVISAGDFIDLLEVDRTKGPDE